MSIDYGFLRHSSGQALMIDYLVERPEGRGFGLQDGGFGGKKSVVSCKD
jgi:hypothetical protein